MGPELHSYRDIVASVGLPGVIEAMRAGLGGAAAAGARVPLRSLVYAENPLRVFGSMPAWSPEHALFIVKVAAFVDSGTAAARSVSSVVVAMSGRSGEVLGILDGDAITNLKGAAVTAIVTDCCASLQARTLAIIGSGVQAREQLRAVLEVRDIRQVRVFSRDPSNVRRFISDARAEHRGVEFIAAASADAAVDRADVVSTATTAETPVFQRTELVPHAHVNCVGGHSVHGREIPAGLLAASLIIVEDVETAVAEAGPVHRNAVEVRRLAELEPLAPRSRQTVFSSTGHAYLDLLTVAHVLKVRSPP